jgi:hypothetical protein
VGSVKNTYEFWNSPDGTTFTYSASPMQPSGAVLIAPTVLQPVMCAET